jgi:hypothetical protein
VDRNCRRRYRDLDVQRRLGLADDSSSFQRRILPLPLRPTASHHRVTNADRIVQEAIERYHLEGGPNVRHFIAAEPDVTSSPGR